MSTWTHKSQECEGTYQFSGTFIVTQGVAANLSNDEIYAVYSWVLALVQEKGGIDYFQVFESEDGRKLYFIDHCSPEMMTQEGFNEEDNHCTLLLSEEY